MALTAADSQRVDLKCRFFKESVAVWEREGLGPARKASECGLVLRPVTVRGPADPGLPFLSQNNNTLLSKALTKGPVHTPVGGSLDLAGALIFGGLTCSSGRGESVSMAGMVGSASWSLG